MTRGWAKVACMWHMPRLSTRKTCPTYAALRVLLAASAPTFGYEEVDDLLQGIALGKTAKRLALTHLLDQSDRNEPSQMVREGRARHVEFRLDLADRRPIASGLTRNRKISSRVLCPSSARRCAASSVSMEANIHLSPSSRNSNSRNTEMQETNHNRTERGSPTQRGIEETRCDWPRGAESGCRNACSRADSSESSFARSSSRSTCHRSRSRNRRNSRPRA